MNKVSYTHTNRWHHLRRALGGQRRSMLRQLSFPPLPNYQPCSQPQKRSSITLSSGRELLAARQRAMARRRQVQLGKELFYLSAHHLSTVRRVSQCLECISSSVGSWRWGAPRCGHQTGEFGRPKLHPCVSHSLLHTIIWVTSHMS